jgi:hypothetical protein
MLDALAKQNATRHVSGVADFESDGRQVPIVTQIHSFVYIFPPTALHALEFHARLE